VVLVGHSYGGAVITQASVDVDNVAGLVYLAAFSLDVGESCASLQQPFPPSLMAGASCPTAFDAPGAPQGPDLYRPARRRRRVHRRGPPRRRIDQSRRGDIGMTTQYLKGNHTIAERMFRHDPSVMLHAPPRTVLYVDPVGDTKLAVNQPSLLFDSDDKPEIAAVGPQLDADGRAS
jgi:pimeloyl-ACP methyl ester carboxylesterase